MALRRIKEKIQGQPAIDGAGVHMVRVLGYQDTEKFDPFLMLDSFDSHNPADYIAGFPMHPHRGIETVTYLISGEIDHEDSIGNSGKILSGESQWMTAGSGILHQEMPQPAGHMLGFQLWLNLPADEKMTEPAYFDIKQEQMGLVETEGAVVRIVSGMFAQQSGVTPKHIPASIFDISLEPGASITIPTKEDENVFVFLITGDAIIEQQRIREKTAVLFGEGSEIVVDAPKDEQARVIFFSGKPLKESIAWGGPIVMNTRQELQEAFEELDRNSFIKHK